MYKPSHPLKQSKKQPVAHHHGSPQMIVVVSLSAVSLTFTTTHHDTITLELGISHPTALTAPRAHTCDGASEESSC